VGLTPDAKGRVRGTLVLDVRAPSGSTRASLRHVEYPEPRLTNLTSGHVHRLDPISRDYPT
jgi:hypothetical protein